MRNIIPLYPEPPAIEQSAEEYDRKECVALYQSADGGNRKFAQWLLDHNSYPNTKIAEWNGCSETKIRHLRKWAKNGFLDSYRSNQRSNSSSNAPLKTNDDFQDDADFEFTDSVESPEIVVDNALDSISGAKRGAEAWRKIFNKSALNSEQKAQLHNAIQNLIIKWRTVQNSLGKGKTNGQEDN